MRLPCAHSSHFLSPVSILNHLIPCAANILLPFVLLLPFSKSLMPWIMPAGRCHKLGFLCREVGTSIFNAATVEMLGMHRLVELVLHLLEESKK